MDLLRWHALVYLPGLDIFIAEFLIQYLSLLEQLIYLIKLSFQIK